MMPLTPIGLEHGAELGEFGEVGSDVGQLVGRERLGRLGVVEQRGRVLRVVEERVERALVRVGDLRGAACHASHGSSDPACLANRGESGRRGRARQSGGQASPIAASGGVRAARIPGHSAARTPTIAARTRNSRLCPHGTLSWSSPAPCSDLVNSPP